MQKTANQIKSEFELLASGHYQIHSFLYAQEFEQQAYENLIYPLMLVYPLGGNLSGTTYTRNYRVVIADRVLKSEGNELEVESDTQLIALDTLAYWMKLGTNERFSITSSNTITPFWEKWGDEVTGHFVDIGIEEFYDFNSCAIPLSSAIPSPSNPCKDARILINSVVYGNAPSDTNFNVLVKDQLGDLVGSLIGGEWIVNTGGACADATYTIEDSLGNVLYTGTIPSGGSVTEVIGNSTLNVNKSDGTLISSRSILAEGTDSYNVADSSAVLKDEDGNVLSTTPIKATETEDIVAPNGDVSVNSVAFDDVLSGGTLDIEVLKSTGNDQIGSKQGQYWRIGDSTAVIKDSANNTLKSEAIMATETENIVINDSVAVIKNSVGTTLKSENILAEATENITINDSSVENSDASYSVDVLAEGSLTLPDSQINVNGVDSGDVVSVKTIDVNLEDSLGAPVTPTSVGLVGNTLTIEVSSGGTPFDPTAFVIEVDTSISIPTSSNANQFEILATSPSLYDVVTSDGQILNANTGNLLITFPSEGVYLIEIKGTIRFVYRNFNEISKILKILNWGTTIQHFDGRNFEFTADFIIEAQDTPIIATWDRFLFNSINRWVGNISMKDWDVSMVLGNRFENTFTGSVRFNSPLTNWDVSGATSMLNMFSGCSSFNQDLSMWDVSSVTNFATMFFNASAFNQNLGAWQLNSGLTTMSQIFRNSGMSTANYTDTIVAWANQVFNNTGAPSSVNMATQTGRTFDTSRSGGANFANAGLARTYLISIALWTISGDTVI
jgi:surface protein